MIEQALQAEFLRTEFSWVDEGVGWTQVGSEWRNDERWELLIEPEEWRIELKQSQEESFSSLQEAVSFCRFTIFSDAITGTEQVAIPILESACFGSDNSLQLCGHWEMEELKW